VADHGNVSGDITVIPNAYHHLISFYGIYLGHMKRLELDAAQAIYSFYVEELNRITQLINAQYIPEPMKQGVHNQGETP
jgi:hypothetical protein